ncbi:MAG: FAD:protein FMN transferase [Candidatus Hydrogenedentes bacterium]|nr:FAD:protein FMN transferase [Candidatus Hydrogenedentota bacterium]
MATAFGVAIVHDDARYAAQAGQAAFAEVDRLEQELSRYIESSDVSRISRLQSGESTRVGLAAFECLRVAARIHRETGGAFDVTVGPLVDCWRAADGTDPDPARLAEVRRHVGMHLIELDPDTFRVGVKGAPIQLDLGGIGKGYALDRAAEILDEWGIEGALLHGGESTALAIGRPPGGAGWRVGVGGSVYRSEAGFALNLRDGAVSGSGIEKKGRHVFDPRTGRPAAGNLAAWARCPSAAVADALSTAFMVMSAAEVEQYCTAHPGHAGMVLPEEGAALKRFGLWERVDG